jgi:hypothetical protein
VPSLSHLTGSVEHSPRRRETTGRATRDLIRSGPSPHGSLPRRDGSKELTCSTSMVRIAATGAAGGSSTESEREMLNMAVVAGVLIRPPQQVELPSGSRIASFEVTVRGPEGPAEVVPATWADPPTWVTALEPRVRSFFLVAYGGGSSEQVALPRVGPRWSSPGWSEQARRPESGHFSPPSRTPYRRAKSAGSPICERARSASSRCGRTR